MPTRGRILQAAAARALLSVARGQGAQVLRWWRSAHGLSVEFHRHPEGECGVL